VSKLIVVRDPARKAAYRCRVCGAEFLAHEAHGYEEHVVSCAEQHDSDLRQMSPRVRLPAFFDPEFGPQDLSRWVRENKLAILEGRKRI
jgi:hypothetical protein